MRKMLVVDDEVGIVEILEGVLVEAGYAVETAASGEEALEHVGNGVPDAVFLNFSMPGLGGRGVLRALQSAPARAAIPVIVMSFLPGEAITVLHHGQAAFLRKPFRVASVLAALQRTLRRGD